MDERLRKNISENKVILVGHIGHGETCSTAHLLAAAAQKGMEVVVIDDLEKQFRDPETLQEQLDRLAESKDKHDNTFMITNTRVDAEPTTSSNGVFSKPFAKASDLYVPKMGKQRVSNNRKQKKRKKAKNGRK